MVEVLSFLNLCARAVILYYFCALLGDIVRAVAMNGPVVRALRDVWIGSTILMTWATVGFLEQAIDFIPWIDLKRDVLDLWVWMPSVVLAVALKRMRKQLHLRAQERLKGDL